MAIPVAHNLIHYKGDTWNTRTYRMYSDVELTIPVDLTGYSAIMQVRKKNTALTVILEWTTDPASGEDPTISFDGDDNNRFNILTRPETDMDLDAGIYSYDLQFTSPEGVVTTYMFGSFTIVQDTTRAQ